MNDITRFLIRLKGIHLSDNERLAMRERLFLYADENPVMAPVASPYLSFFSFIGSRRFSTYAMALVVLVAAGGGVTLGAEGSVPGDTLYSIKVNVNEPLMTAFAGTPIKQAKVASEIATRRADEAVVLANRGELTDAREEYLSEEFDEHVKIATAKTEKLATLDSTAADTVKADLAANLASEAQALSAQQHEGGKLLRVLVAISERIEASKDDRPALALEQTEPRAAKVAVAIAEDAGSAAASVEVNRTMLMATTEEDLATSSTTTEEKPMFLPHFFGKLHITATTTLTGASSTLQTKTWIFPKLDVAIPSKFQRDGSSELDLHR